MRNIDWLDIILHVVVALVAVAIMKYAMGVYDWLAVLLNAAFWFLREGWQQHKKGKPLNPTEWSTQKTLEWVCPSIVGGFV